MSYSERIRRLARRREQEEDPYAELRLREKHGFGIGPVVLALVVGMALLAVSLGLFDPDPLLHILSGVWTWFALKA